MALKSTIMKNHPDLNLATDHDVIMEIHSIHKYLTTTIVPDSNTSKEQLSTSIHKEAHHIAHEYAKHHIAHE
jgi:hypothetical protein